MVRSQPGVQTPLTVTRWRLSVRVGFSWGPRRGRSRRARRTRRTRPWRGRLAVDGGLGQRVAGQELQLAVPVLLEGEADALVVAARPRRCPRGSCELPVRGQDARRSGAARPPLMRRLRRGRMPEVLARWRRRRPPRPRSRCRAPWRSRGWPGRCRAACARGGRVARAAARVMLRELVRAAAAGRPGRASRRRCGCPRCWCSSRPAPKDDCAPTTANRMFAFV